MANYRLSDPQKGLADSQYERSRRIIDSRRQPQKTRTGNYRLDDQEQPILTPKTSERQRTSSDSTISRVGNYRVNSNQSLGQPQESIIRPIPVIGPGKTTKNQTHSKNVRLLNQHELTKKEQPNQFSQTAYRPRPESKVTPVRQGNYKVTDEYNSRSLRHLPNQARRPKARVSSQDSSLQRAYYRFHELVNPANSKVSKPLLPSGRSKILLVFVLIYLTMLINGWQLMPFNKINYLWVSGNQYVSSQAILNSSRIRPWDSLNQVMHEKPEIERLIIKENPLVHSLVFKRNDWHSTEISVQENQVVARIEQNHQQLPLLENAVILQDSNSLMKQPTMEQLPLLKNFSQKDKLKDICQSLREIEPSLINQMESIELSRDPNKPSSILVQMKDGNQIKAIIPTFDKKVKYYPKILAIIGQQKGLINFEVGAYFTPKANAANSVKLDSNLDN
ncbi:cell division protein FtsQ/DivIB [Vaginisenegalia massiliensis]|uniref:cell division protein FtsQ/DivIB n=1 Tax=Vaginisenegalia massiliensis TaxID=2058294 RepID=UPI000F53482F|nr:hypothetical protein [Vaginisenegalia massiliensis]